MSDVTRILGDLGRGEGNAENELLEAVYHELHQLASAKLSRERSDHTLQATALVNEAWLRIADSAKGFENRRHFFGAAAEAMRRILVERARKRARLKHGGAWGRRDLEMLDPAAPADSVDLLALDEALAKLAAEDERKAKLVELRYFTGLTLVEASEVLDISKATADRWWAYARAFLYDEVSKGDSRE